MRLRSYLDTLLHSKDEPDTNTPPEAESPGKRFWRLLNADVERYYILHPGRRMNRASAKDNQY